MSTPWEAHRNWMLENYLQHDPDCFWCGVPVYMALQGFYGGGTWTTNAEHEGPCQPADGAETKCSASPDGEHDPLPVAFEL